MTDAPDSGHAFGKKIQKIILFSYNLYAYMSDSPANGHFI